MAPLARLSAILGSVHFLRTLCGDPNARLYRDKMTELLAAQKASEADRRILVASFNSGYRAFESTYRVCTPAARLAVERYQKEGSSLSREISARYGN
ncbi:TIGR02301 family protein [Consotaella salsifontis]|uniref:TIGR02301 family protein n=2 Tax=Consotaella salsifontis TaxID=1365950 RepID=A0A1T4T7G2_9HYPH|nr:TIGR02301 family protein [Consotaella salsifontis]